MLLFVSSLHSHVLTDHWHTQDSTVPTPLALSTATPTALLATPTKPHPAAIVPFPQTSPVDPPAAGRTIIIHTNLASPTSEAPPPIVAAAPTGARAEQDAFDALTARFAELKKR